MLRGRAVGVGSAARGAHGGRSGGVAQSSDHFAVGAAARGCRFRTKGADGGGIGGSRCDAALHRGVAKQSRRAPWVGGPEVATPRARGKLVAILTGRTAAGLIAAPSADAPARALTAQRLSVARAEGGRGYRSGVRCAGGVDRGGIAGVVRADARAAHLGRQATRIGGEGIARPPANAARAQVSPIGAAGGYAAGMARRIRGRGARAKTDARPGVGVTLADEARPTACRIARVARIVAA